MQEAGSEILVYKPGLAQLVGARPSVGERARSNFRLLSTIKKRIKTSPSLLHESHQIFRFSLLLTLEGKLAVSAQEVHYVLLNTLPDITPYLQISNNNNNNNDNNDDNNNDNNTTTDVLFQIKYQLIHIIIFYLMTFFII